MTLHDAIIKVLQMKNRSMTTQEIADELNKNRLYVKKDKSLITAFQIHGRTRNYNQLFDRDGSTVILRNTREGSSRKVEVEIPGARVNDAKVLRPDQLEKYLMNEKNFKSIKHIEHEVPNCPGLYCLRLSNINNLPKQFSQELKARGHNILYIGIASVSLHKRMYDQELRAKGHGTFFRSIGGVLGYRPPLGSLRGKKNKRNYKFSKSDEDKIKQWLDENLVVNWVKYRSNLESLEGDLIKKYKPIINISKNPYYMNELKAIRKECVAIANKYCVECYFEFCFSGTFDILRFGTPSLQE